MLIPNKKIFYDLASKGLCGNTPKTWNSFLDYINNNGAETHPIVGLRRLVNAHKTLSPGMHYSKLPNYLLQHMIEPGTYIITAVPNPTLDHTLRIQGELTWINGSWYLYYTHKGGYMRQALIDEPNHATGWKVIELLRKYCSHSDYNDLMSLFEKYTEDTNYPVIEFSVTRDNCGRIPGRNTIIWEIRHY